MKWGWGRCLSYKIETHFDPLRSWIQNRSFTSLNNQRFLSCKRLQSFSIFLNYIFPLRPHLRTRSFASELHRHSLFVLHGFVFLSDIDVSDFRLSLLLNFASYPVHMRVIVSFKHFFVFNHDRLVPLPEEVFTFLHSSPILFQLKILLDDLVHIRYFVNLFESVLRLLLVLLFFGKGRAFSWNLSTFQRSLVVDLISWEFS